MSSECQVDVKSVSNVCQMCLKEIPVKRMENGFDKPDPYPRHITHELKSVEGETLLQKDYLVCSRRCDDLTKIQFRGEIFKAGLLKDANLEVTGQEKLKDMGS